MVQRIKLVVSYLGGEYAGWQIQPNAKTVQGIIQEQLSDFLKEPITLIGSGRTDAGVHALQQVAHFDTQNRKIEGKDYKGILNYRLPDDIVILDSCTVPLSFHARKSAIKKTYRYQIYNRDTIPAIYRSQFAHIRYPLEERLMVQAAQYLIGTHDFKALAASQNSTQTTIRTIYDLLFIPAEENQIIFEITGNGFLMKMVRNIAGTLIEVGRRIRSESSLPDLIASKDRKNAGATAPACGLILKRVYYGSIH